MAFGTTSGTSGQLAQRLPCRQRLHIFVRQFVIQLLHQLFPQLKLGGVVREGLLQPVHNGTLAAHINNPTLPRGGNTMRLHEQPQVSEPQLVPCMVTEPQLRPWLGVPTVQTGCVGDERRAGEIFHRNVGWAWCGRRTHIIGFVVDRDDRRVQFPVSPEHKDAADARPTGLRVIRQIGAADHGGVLGNSLLRGLPRRGLVSG
ncbi:hypothetical protein IY73_04180 [Lawsonella clevelandensis]|uniref:Uncharacterized protein n=1 Tax=Lawsonella clevelandensis TaxID=1528099 RepID=A0A0M4MC82_9ACTN|nr:hypothetical protein AL705_04385 [Lawsonella clevelandensis]ALE34649.1 hypothetical protein IY73_04180 [Lawsonella clevelandensis]